MSDKKPKPMVYVIFFAAMFLTAAIAAAFLLALMAGFESSISGFFYRWFYFTWRYCLPTGIMPVIFFFLIFRRRL